jgi:hypothetical protein
VASAISELVTAKVQELTRFSVEARPLDGGKWRVSVSGETGAANARATVVLALLMCARDRLCGRFWVRTDDPGVHRLLVITGLHRTPGLAGVDSLGR